MSDDKYAISSGWANASDFKKPFDYLIERSGQTVLMRRLDMADILKLGVAEELDFMSKGLLADDTKKSETPKDAVQNVLLKAENFEKMEKMINKVVAEGVIKPKLYHPPLHEAARQAGLVYIDSVPFEDRMELFSEIFDSEGLSTFRKEQEVSVGVVSDVQDVQLPSDGPVAVRSEDTEGVLSQ